MNPAAISFAIFFLIAAFLSSVKHHSRCFHRLGAFIDINSMLSQLF
jgi:hypothetical protein